MPQGDDTVRTRRAHSSDSSTIGLGSTTAATGQPVKRSRSH